MPGSWEGKGSTCPADVLRLLVCLRVNYWTLVSGRNIKEFVLDSDRPKVNTNQVIPHRGDKTAHLHLVKLVFITDTLLIIIVMKIIISLSKQVLFIHVSQKCFAKFGNRDLLYLFIEGGVLYCWGNRQKDSVPCPISLNSSSGPRAPSLLAHHWVKL